MTITYQWRGDFANDEINRLHAEAFESEAFEDWDWRTQVARHSLGWVVAREGEVLIGFVNVIWDGLLHAWIQDTMVSSGTRRQGVGTELVARATNAARAAGCQYLHVDFEGHLRGFYFDTCGFRPTNAGLIEL